MKLNHVISYTVEYRRIVGRLISKVTLFKPSIFVSSYGTELMFSFVVWFNMCGDRSHFLFTKFSFTYDFFFLNNPWHLVDATQRCVQRSVEKNDLQFRPNVLPDYFFRPNVVLDGTSHGPKVVCDQFSVRNKPENSTCPAG